MDKPERDQPSRPELTPAAALLASIEAHREHHIVKMTPLRAVLPLVAAWVRATETRLAALEADSHPPIGQDDIYDRLERLERR